MDPSPSREEELFAAALALPAEERAAFLKRECGENDALRSRVEALLRAHEQAGGFLETPPVADLAGDIKPPPPADVAVGTRIDRYKLLEKLGEGGCGVVYLAEQEEPVRRQVALKVIRLGMDTREVIARFEAERQALALMDHPNIAKVLDAGATEAGRPYFVMELVRGSRITTYCDQHNLPTAERLRLFAQVCHAIQHAHQKGVIHRDIKPSNILVTLQDGAPVPKIIDFGIAKATQGRLTDQTLYTAFEQFIGTPAYMSPEQAELSSEDVDTRSDIYSLGVLLYELLTGHTPFETRELLKAGLDEMRRRIRETQPPKPSTRLGTLDTPALDTIAHQRATEPPKLIQLVRGDLDWIVMCCLEKNRTRRYETAEALALDVVHYLGNESVRARPPSGWYRLQKLVRRNRLIFGTVAVIAVALIVGLGLSLWMYARERAAREQAVVAEQHEAALRQQADVARDRAIAAEAEQRRLRHEAEKAQARAVAAEQEQRRQRQAADQARDREAKQRTLAEEARNNEARERAQAQSDRKKAETEAAKSEQIAHFLTDMLKSVAPSVAQGRDTTMLREILDKTADRVGRELKNNPEIQIALERVLGETYLNLDDYGRSEALLQTAQTKLRALGGAETLLMSTLLYDLAQVRLMRDDPAGAETLTRQALALRRKLLGNDDPSVAVSLDQLSMELMFTSKMPEAEAAAQEALAIDRKGSGNESPNVADTLDYLAMIRVMRGDLTGAETMARDALAIQRKSGKKRYDVTARLLFLASILKKQGKNDRAEDLYRGALDFEQRVFGKESVPVAYILDDLGTLLADRGDFATAESYLRKALAIERKRLGAQNLAVAATLNDLAKVLFQRHEYVGAEALCRQALGIQKKVLGPENVAAAATMLELAESRWGQGDMAGAEALARDALALQRRLLGNDHPALVTTLSFLSACSLERGDWAAAETPALEARRIAVQNPAVDQRLREAIVGLLAGLYQRWAKTDPTKASAAAEWKRQWKAIKETHSEIKSAHRTAEGDRPR